MSREAKDKLSDFGIRLKVAFNNESNQSIAEKLGVVSSALTAYIQGRIPPSEKLIEITNLTKCNLNWLLTGEGNRYYESRIQRPQGIIIQGSKGGVGTSTCAVFIAINLALKGFGVLLVNDEFDQCFSLLFSGREDLLPKKTTELKSDSKLLETRFHKDLYISTRLKNLDLFLFRHDIPTTLTKNQLSIFDLNTVKISNKYNFVIFDAQRAENPFYYSDTGVMKNFYLEPVLRNSKVIVPYDVMQSDTNNVRRTIKYAEDQKPIYPDADFSGLFFVKQRDIRKSSVPFYNKRLATLKKEFKGKIFNSEIEYHPQLNGFIQDVQKIMFNRKTKFFSNFSELTDELLLRINYRSKSTI